MSSFEFAEWLAFYLVEAELSGAIEHEPTPDELGGKLVAWAAAHNARQQLAGKVTQEPK